MMRLRLGRPVGLLLAMAMVGALLAGCGSSSNGGGTGNLVVDEFYDFSRAGVLPNDGQRDAGRGRILGTLTTSTGAPVASVDVTLYKLVNSRQAGLGYAVATSTANGRYVFGNVPPGNYRVAVRGQLKNTVVRSGADSTLNFTGLQGGGGGGTRGKWTVMIFMDADNDLERFGVADVNELERLPASQDVTFVVLMDRIPGYDSSNGNWTDARRFVIRPDNDTERMTSAETPNATVMGELDMGKVGTLTQFVNWAQTTYPADHYVLGLWNHGSGWRPVGRAAGDTSRGINFDDTSNTYIKAHEMGALLQSVERIDLVAIDASLMMMGETIVQMAQGTDYICGSEESPPGEGYPYHRIYAPLVNDPNRLPSLVARDIVNNYVSDVGTRSSVTQSAFDTSKIGALTTAIRDYATALKNADRSFHSQILGARTAAQGYGSGASIYEGNRDLIDFIDQVNARTGSSSLRTAGDAVKNALNSAMLAEGHTGSDLARSHGLAVWIPSYADWLSLRSSYILTTFANSAGWADWLDYFYR